MSTGELRTYFEDKRFLPNQRLKDTFFDYLLLRLREISQRVWGGQRGVFGVASLVSGGNDKFSVTTLPVDLLDGDGNILTLEGTDATGIQFENTAATPYYVAARHNLVPSGVLRNQRNNVIFYDMQEDRVGELAEPDAVSEVGGTLEIVVDSVFEAGVSHAGRLVSVWLRRPLTTDWAIAVEENLTVSWVGGVNKVTTAALLGQAGGGASTNPADYQVFAQGVTVRKTDLRPVSPYAFLGIVTGGGAGSPPAGYSIVDQIDVSDGINPDLQEAYTAGRVITPSATYGGAVKISSADSGDEMRSLLHLDRKDATEDLPLALALVSALDTGVNQLNLVPSRAENLQLYEPGTSQVTAGLVNLTRGAVATEGIDPYADFALLSGFTTPAMNGLFAISARTTNTVTVKDVGNGSPPGTWNSGETGNVTFLRSRLAVGEFFAGDEHPSLGQGVVLQGRVGDDAAARTFPRGSAAGHIFYDDTTPDPRVQARLTNKAVIQAETEGLTGDPANCQLRLRRYGNTDWMQFMLYMEVGDVSGIPVAILQALRPSGGTILESNAVTLSGSTITFTGGGVDLTDVDLRLTKKLHVVWIQNAFDGADDGLYVIWSFTGTTITAYKLQGGPASFVGGSAQCRILVPRYILSNSYPHTNVYSDDVLKWWTGITHVLRDGDGDVTRFRIIPDGVYGNLIELFDIEDTPGYWARFNLGAKGTTEGVFEFNRRATFKEQFDEQHCVLVEGGGQGGATLRTDVHNISLAVKSFLGGPTADEFQIGMHDGAIVRPPGFRDDFMYEDWNSKALNPKFYDAGADGVGDVWVSWGDNGVILQTSTTISDMAWLMGPRKLNADAGKNWNWRFRALVALGQFDNANSMIQIGLRNNLFPSGNYEFYFQRMATVSGGNWEFKGWDNGAGFAINTGISCVAGEWYWLDIVILSTTTVLYYVGRVGYNSSPNAMSNFGTKSVTNMNGEASLYFPELRVRTDEGFTKTLYCAFWEWYNGEKPLAMVASLPPDSPV